VSELPQSAPDLQQIYRERFSGTLQYRQRVWKELTSRCFSTWVPPESAVLDLGCGYCEFINNIRARKKYGMDLNPDAVGHAATDVTILQQDCSQPWPVQPESLDAVFTSNFFEHLPTKTHLEQTILQAWLALKRGGTLIAMGPNIKYVPGAYWDFYDHHIALTESSLAEVMKKCGFSMEQVIGRFLPYTMSNDKKYPLWMLRLYLLLPVCWPLFGKQFLIIARKPTLCYP
jgi:SAM-dependent methyltransferase